MFAVCSPIFLIWLSFVPILILTFQVIMDPTSFCVTVSCSLQVGFVQLSGGIYDDGSVSCLQRQQPIFSNNNLILWSLPRQNVKQMEADWQMYWWTRLNEWIIHFLAHKQLEFKHWEFVLLWEKAGQLKKKKIKRSCAERCMYRLM